MLQNAYFLAKIGADTAENGQHSAEILPIGRRVAEHGWLRPAEPLEPRATGARVAFLSLQSRASGDQPAQQAAHE